MKKILVLMVFVATFMLALGTPHAFAYVGDILEPTAALLEDDSVIQLTNESTTYDVQFDYLTDYYLYYVEVYDLDEANEQLEIKKVADFTDDTYTYYDYRPSDVVGDIYHSFTSADNVTNITITVVHDATVGTIDLNPINMVFSDDGSFTMTEVTDTTSTQSNEFNEIYYLVPVELLTDTEEKYDDVTEITDQFTFSYIGNAMYIQSDLESGWYFVEIDNTELLYDIDLNVLSNIELIRNINYIPSSNEITNDYIQFEFFLEEDGGTTVATNIGATVSAALYENAFHIFDGVPSDTTTDIPSNGSGVVVTPVDDTASLFGVEWYWYALFGTAAALYFVKKKK